MGFLQKVQQPEFWKLFLKVAIPFFVILTIITLLFNSWSNIISGDFTAVSEEHLNNGKWVPFFTTKTIAAILYGLWMTNRSMK